ILASRKYFGTPRKQAELYGTYIANYEIAKETLVLKDEGTFEQEVTLKETSQVNTTRGSWSYDPVAGEVTFHNFMSVIDVSKELNPDYAQPKGSVVLPASVWFGRIRLGLDEWKLYKKAK
ncbi:MAG: hypothetical protein HY664_08075, partial [Chloroflexi bacterium]|nr:hypothetical protein [Chloroflexota bacterium]